MGTVVKKEDFLLLSKLDKGIRFMEKKNKEKFKVALSKNSELKKMLLKEIVEEKEVA